MPETKKTEPNPNRKKNRVKPEKTEPKPCQTDPNPIQTEKTKVNRFELVLS